MSRSSKAIDDLENGGFEAMYSLSDSQSFLYWLEFEQLKINIQKQSFPSIKSFPMTAISEMFPTNLKYSCFGSKAHLHVPAPVG